MLPCLREASDDEGSDVIHVGVHDGLHGHSTWRDVGGGQHTGLRQTYGLFRSSLMSLNAGRMIKRRGAWDVRQGSWSKKLCIVIMRSSAIGFQVAWLLTANCWGERITRSWEKTLIGTCDRHWWVLLGSFVGIFRLTWIAWSSYLSTGCKNKRRKLKTRNLNAWLPYRGIIVVQGHIQDFRNKGF